MQVAYILKRQTGIGLLELMLSIVLGAVILMVSVSYFQSVTNNQKLTQANGMVADIYTASKDYVKAQSSSAISLQSLIDAGFLTKYYKKNPWAGSVTVAPNKASGSMITQVAITMDGVPAKQCSRLVQRLQQTTTSTSENAKCDKRTLTVLYDLY